MIDIELQTSLFLRLLLSGSLAGLLGAEREWGEHPAGLRTHVFVGVSATLLISLSVAFAHSASAGDGVCADPLRAVEAVMAGTSVIGAGTIFFSRRESWVRGLTTAASLLATAVIGIAVGLSMYLLAALTTLSLLVLLTVSPRSRNGVARPPEAPLSSDGNIPRRRD